MIANFLANALGGLVDKEKMTHDTIKNALNEVLAELNEDRHFEDHLTSKDFFIMIKPIGVVKNDGETEVESMKYYIYKMEPTGPKVVREITLKEILGIEP